MTTKEERMTILRMIEEGKISAEEGARLIRALGAPQAAPKAESRATSEPFNTSRSLRILVTDLGSSRPRVNVTVPVGLIKLALRWIPAQAGVDLSDIQAAIDAGVRGPLVEVTDQEQNVHVEISLL